MSEIKKRKVVSILASKPVSYKPIFTRRTNQFYIKMKKALFSLCILLLGIGKAAYAQVPYDAEKKVTSYNEVVDVPGMTKDQLYDRAMSVLDDIYKEVAKKMATQDKQNGIIELNCSTRVSLKDPKSGVMNPAGFIKYKLKIQFKDGKYRYEFYDFHLDKGGYKYGIEHFIEKDYTVKPEDRADEKLAYLDNDIRNIIKKLKEGMVSAKVEQKSDW